MGVFVFCNRKVYTEKVNDVLQSRGHVDVKCVANNDYTLVHAKKIIKPSQNYISGKELGGAENDFIVGIGSFFYKGTYGAQALKHVYTDVDTVLRDNPVYGNWAFCIRKGDTTWVFNDLNGSLRLYYRQEGDKIVVSSSLLSTIATMKSPKFDIVRLSGFLVNEGAKEIPFVQGVENVDSRFYLKIKDGLKPEWIEREISEAPRIEGLDEAVDYVKTLIADQLDHLKDIGKEEVSVELTGGLDSRLIACIIKNGGLNYNFVHFPLYGPDKEVAYTIAKGLNKEILLQVDDSELAPVDFKKHYGEFDACFNFFNHHANPRRIVKNRFQFTGSQGECLTTPVMYSMDISLMKDPRMDVLLPLLTFKPRQRLLSEERQKELESYLFNYFEVRGFRRGVVLSECEQQDFNTSFNGLSDFRTISGYMYHINRYSIYNEWHFMHNVSNISFNAKCGRKISIALINSLDKDLAGFPFVSRLLTRGASVRDTPELPAQYKSYAKYKKMMPAWMQNLYYKRKISSFDNNMMSDIDFDYYKEIINITELKRYPALYKEVFERLYSIEVIRNVMGITK